MCKSTVPTGHAYQLLFVYIGETAKVETISARYREVDRKKHQREPQALFFYLHYILVW